MGTVVINFIQATYLKSVGQILLERETISQEPYGILPPRPSNFPASLSILSSFPCSQQRGSSHLGWSFCPLPPSPADSMPPLCWLLLLAPKILSRPPHQYKACPSIQQPPVSAPSDQAPVLSASCPPGDTTCTLESTGHSTERPPAASPHALSAFSPLPPACLPPGPTLPWGSSLSPGPDDTALSQVFPATTGLQGWVLLYLPFKSRSKGQALALAPFLPHCLVSTLVVSPLRCDFNPSRMLAAAQSASEQIIPPLPGSLHF